MGPDAASDAVTRLEDDDGFAGLREPAGGGEARIPAPDDAHVGFDVHGEANSAASKYSRHAAIRPSRISNTAQIGTTSCRPRNVMRSVRSFITMSSDATCGRRHPRPSRP